MSYVGIIAAGGEGRRTGLGEYTSKAALPLRGRPLLSHQIDFLRRSGVDRAIVICRPAHARLLGGLLSPEERALTAFVLSDCATGWAGEVARAAAHVVPDDEVLLVSCDNLHEGAARGIDEADCIFTYTSWTRTDASPTSGPVLARVATAWGRPDASAWVQRPGVGYAGDLFTGYVAARGAALFEAIREVRPSARGEKEITAMLEVLARSPRTRAVPYPGEYVDVADLDALARADAHLRGDPDGEPSVGAAILACTADRVLLAERSDGRGWVPPGGMPEPGESYVDAAIRETTEEVGLVFRADELRLLGVYPCRGKRGEPAATVVFRAAAEASVGFAYAASHEIARVETFARDALAEILIPFNLRDAVRDHFAGRELDCR